jgi:hypothetical protein
LDADLEPPEPTTNAPPSSSSSSAPTSSKSSSTSFPSVASTPADGKKAPVGGATADDDDLPSMPIYASVQVQHRDFFCVFFFFFLFRSAILNVVL